MKRIFIAATLPLMFTACASIGTVSKTDLQHHHWSLTSINGEAINTDIKSDLELGEHFTINGLAGCNRFMGNAELNKGALSAPNLATTMMACNTDEQEIETAVLQTLTEGAKVKNKGQQLILTGETYTLVYKLADWM